MNFGYVTENGVNSNDMLECAIHPITYRGEGILATVVKIW